MYKKAFTLLEIMLTITVIGILITVIFVSINPQKQLADTRNSKRKADVLSIYTAISEYRNNNDGKLPDGIISANTNYNICQIGCSETATQIDISTELSPYLRFNSVPIDPLQSGGVLTGYILSVSSQGRVNISAPLAENGVLINTLE